MNNLLKHLLIGVLISLLGFYLQLHDIEKFPPIGDTMDEVKGAFNGINLILTGVPRSWSWFEEYGYFPIQNINGYNFRIVEPYFDDPPLFALMTGAYALSLKMNSLEKVDILTMRYPMTIIGALNIFLLFLLVYRLRGHLEASLAALIYATVPTFVLGSRLAIADNMIITTTLASLILFLGFLNTKKGWVLILSAIIAASSFLIKSTGVYVSVALIFLSFALKNQQALLIYLSFLFISLLAWFWYGYHYNWQLFLNLLSTYGGRALNEPSPIIHLFDMPRIAQSLLATDGWIVWGWICLIFYSFFTKKEEGIERLILPVTIGAYLVFFAIMSGHTYGWYRFPFYPFLAWAMAKVFISTFENPRFLSIFFFISLPISSSFIYGTGGMKWDQFGIRIYQILFVILFLPIMLLELTKAERFKTIVRSILIYALVVGIIYNITTIAFYQDYFWNRLYSQ